MANGTPPQNDPDTTRALEHVDRLYEVNRQRNAALCRRATAVEIHSVGIIGAGVMGSLIAAAGLRAGLSVVLCDSNPDALAEVPRRIAETAVLVYASSREEAQALGRAARTTGHLAEVARCDLVLEAVKEDRAVKRRLFAELEPLCRPTSLIASNTSTIPISELARSLSAPARFCGIHFFLTGPANNLVEVIPGHETDEATLAAAVGFVDAIQRVPLVVDDGPGFLVNRVMYPYLGESTQLLLEGVRAEQIEQAALDFGLAMGPLAQLDLTGLDTALNCGWVFAGAFEETMATSPVLMAMVKAGRLGCKSGAGFFRYQRAADGGLVRSADPAIETILARWAGQPRAHTRQSITARLIIPMLLEATRVLAQSPQVSPAAIDLGLITGLGFPKQRGGLLYWADRIGIDGIFRMLEPMQQLGKHLQPTPLLQGMAADGGSFYGD